VQAPVRRVPVGGGVGSSDVSMDVRSTR
jgi:hypothetical protein